MDKTLQEVQDQGLGTVTRATTSLTKMPRTRREKLERWAAILDLEDRARTLKPLIRVEFLPRREREALRRDESPLALAYADPLLRQAGLKDDTLGTAMDFFDLTDKESHYLLCDCHYHGGMTMTPETVANRIRGVAAKTTWRSTFATIQGWFRHSFVGATA